MSCYGFSWVTVMTSFNFWFSLCINCREMVWLLTLGGMLQRKDGSCEKCSGIHGRKESYINLLVWRLFVI